LLRDDGGALFEGHELWSVIATGQFWSRADVDGFESQSVFAASFHRQTVKIGAMIEQPFENRPENRIVRFHELPHGVQCLAFIFCKT